jgi:hypothetical protein
LLKYGMGWLGWTEDQTLQTTIPAIELAYEGRCDMLRSIFGGGDEPAPAPAATREMTPELFDAVFS